MSDKMIPISFERLLKGLLQEYKANNSFLSVPVKRNTDVNYISKIGPAAGPHTQLAGNIVAAYAAGASHFELKTVQIMEGEELGIQKPCIYSTQEVYNTEWSTELSVKQAAEEYVKAYLLLNILNKEFNLGSKDGFSFIMSVGYDLSGIQSEKIDGFIEAMKNASQTTEWKKDITFLLQNVAMFEHVTKEYIESISPVITNTITLSTMHGCKSEEIEAIATYLLEEKQLSTYVKMNPTLLGKETIHNILEQMGYGHISLSDHTFEMDLNFDHAVHMLCNLQEVARRAGKLFGVKLTNTLPVEINKNELAGTAMYLSGAALFPIAIGVAAKLEREFGGKLPISYSGGADVNNIKDILETGIYPVTVSSILLKNGGYKNLTKMNEQADTAQITRREELNVNALNALAEKAVSQTGYFNKEYKSFARLENYSLLCSKCNNCVDVCPNRANRKVTLGEKAYVLHYDNLCNECGNCSFFCITRHNPYLDKMTIFHDKEAFHSSENEGVFIKEDKAEYRIQKEEEKEIVKQLEEYYEF